MALHIGYTAALDSTCAHQAMPYKCNQARCDAKTSMITDTKAGGMMGGGAGLTDRLLSGNCIDYGG